MSNLVRDAETGRYIKTRIEFWTPAIWGDGFVDSKGYFRVYRPDHPKASTAGWVHRYQVVWWLSTGNIPNTGMDIHHNNEIKLDDRFDNLVLKEHVEHSILSNKASHEASQVLRTCVICEKEFTIPRWRLNQDNRGLFCSIQCRRRDIKTPETRRKQSESIRAAWARRRNNAGVTT